MKFQALAQNAEEKGHPIQSFSNTFSNSEAVIRDWSRMIADKYQTKVVIWVVELRILDEVLPTPKEEEKELSQ